MSNIYNLNSSKRTPLDYEKLTIKFKTLYPNYQDWRLALTTNGVPDAHINIEDYKMIQVIIGNAYLMFSTDVKNNGYIAIQFNLFYSIMKREEKLYNLDNDDWLLHKSDTERSLYVVGRRLDTGLVEGDYLDNRVREVFNNKLPAIEKMAELKKLTHMIPPNLNFVFNLSTSICLPLQPNQHGGIYE